MPPPASPAVPARFVTGSPLRHVIVMAGTGAIGLVAVFAVDLLNLFYISLLGQQAIAAAIGFAGAITFFQTSLAIGLTIGVGAVVGREIGAGEAATARRVAAVSLAIMIVVLVLVSAATIVWVDPLLALLGAVGETHRLAANYLSVTSLSLPMLAVAMCCSALLRAVGDARRSMNVTLAGALVTACLDPALIFGLHLGIEGAAISTICSRLVIAGLGWHGAAHVHGLVGAIARSHVLADLRAMLTVALPAIATNLATPVGAAYVTRSMARFGADAVSGQATIDRITPVAFGLVYALSGAIGPIIAQNLGAAQVDRIRRALRDALLVVIATVLIAWAILAAGQDLVVRAFSAHGDGAVLVHLFCSLTAAGFLFTGALYVANAAFNNLGFPYLSMLFNWGRATLGTIPFVSLGADYGPSGVLIGLASGSLIFGIVAVLVAFRAVDRLAQRGVASPNFQIPVPASSTGSAAMASLAARPSQRPHH